MSDKNKQEAKEERKRRGKAAKKAMKKTTRIVFGVIGGVILVVALLFIGYAISWIVNDEQGFGVILVALLVGAVGLFIDYKIAMMMKDSILREREKERKGTLSDGASAASSSLTVENTKGLSENEIADRICNEYSGKSGGSSYVDYYVNRVTHSGTRFTIEVKVTANWDPGADKADYYRREREYANELSGQLKRDILSTVKSCGLRNASVAINFTFAN